MSEQENAEKLEIELLQIYNRFPQIFNIRRMEPHYSNRADYNTNSKSYYDYLARYNYALGIVSQVLQRLLDRNIEVNDTATIDFTKIGDWIDNGKGCCQFDDIIKLKANVKLSDEEKQYIFEGLNPNTFTVENSIEVIGQEGLWSPDFTGVLEKIADNIDKINKKISTIEGDITNIKNQITNIIGRLDDLEDLINGLMGLNYATLIKGTDYDLTFYNGWSANDLSVRVSLASNLTTVIITGSASDPETRIVNGDLLNNTRFHHGADQSSDDWLKARVVKITFKGKYAALNTAGKFNASGNAILNVRPINYRASFSANYGSAQYDGGQLISLVSYDDGYNTQFSQYNVQAGDTLLTDYSNLKYQWTARVAIPK